MKNSYCTLCKNHCPLENPKCPEALSAVKRASTEGEHCKICKNRCSYNALGCETGRIMAQITGKLKR